jgi:hypothetical protein
MTRVAEQGTGRKEVQDGVQEVHCIKAPSTDLWMHIPHDTSTEGEGSVRRKKRKSILQRTIRVHLSRRAPEGGTARQKNQEGYIHPFRDWGVEAAGVFAR